MKCFNVLQEWKLNHFVPFLAFSLNLVGIQFTSESKLNAFFHEHFNSSCILKAYCWTSKSTYIHTLKSWWVSYVLFWEQTHSLKGSSVKYVNPKRSVLGPVLWEQNAFVFSHSSPPGSTSKKLLKLIQDSICNYETFRRPQHWNSTAALSVQKPAPSKTLHGFRRRQPLHLFPCRMVLNRRP